MMRKVTGRAKPRHLQGVGVVIVVSFNCSHDTALRASVGPYQSTFPNGVLECFSRLPSHPAGLSARDSPVMGSVRSHWVGFTPLAIPERVVSALARSTSQVASFGWIATVSAIPHCG